jgi:hypothetical protein
MPTNSVTPSMPDCAWSGCGQPGPVEVLVTIQGEPAKLACSLGCYCVGHAVIVGIDAQTCGGGLWYRPPSPMARRVAVVN